MKVLFSILLVCFFFRGDAQPLEKKDIALNNINVAASPDKTKAISTDTTSSSVSVTGAKNSADSIAPKRDALLGIASIYSPKLEGTETSTGETFSHKYLTAASNFFKLNTWVKITNLKTGKSVVVRINDRMHPAMAAKGRVADLSISAAKKIGLTILAGLTKVKVEEVVKGTLQ